MLLLIKIFLEKIFSNFMSYNQGDLTDLILDKKRDEYLFRLR
jgi:hypothetical protein